MSSIDNFIKELGGNFISLVKSIGVLDVFDIILVAVLIYYAFNFLRNRRAGKLVFGVVILFALQLLSDLLGLVATQFILQNVLQLGLIALLILFQPELRSALEKMGGSGALRSFIGITGEREDKATAAIAAVASAAADMSRNKTGALMVFERKNMLDDAIKTGTALDCTVNAELLKNIFWNKAPLHDGAVIVRAGRIVGAGCMLPMSGNVNLSRELGMRHRAGIGASEHTDAVVAIVSEETGSISVAVGGMLKRHLAPETLERLLRNELLPERENDEAASKFKLGNLLRFGKGKKQDGNENS